MVSYHPTKFGGLRHCGSGNKEFRHNFRDSLNPLCNPGNATESSKHYLLHCSNFKHEKQSLLQNIGIIKSSSLFKFRDDHMIQILFLTVQKQKLWSYQLH